MPGKAASMHAHCEIETCYVVAGTLMLRRVPAVLARLAAKVSPPRQRCIEDVLLDTRDMRLAQAGAALRLRLEEGTSAELTLKSLAPFSGGLARRAELSERLRRVPRPLAGRCPGTHIARRVRPLLGGHPLRICFRLRQRRDVYTVTTRRGAVLLVSVDAVTLPGNAGHPLHLIEVEWHSGAVTELKRFSTRLARRLKLKPATESKYDRGLRAAGLARPLPPGHTPPPRAATDVSSCLAEVIRTHAAAIRRHAAGTLLDLDPEAVHDMRVACRRLRATLESFDPAAAERFATPARDRVVRLTRFMGNVRDADVFLAALQARMEALTPAQRHALASPLAQWRRARERLHARLAVTLQGRAFSALLVALENVTRRLDTMATEEAPYRVKAARTRIRHLMRRTRRLGRSLGPDAPDGKLHHLRILCKKLRYACECLEAVQGEATARFARHTARLQGLLGHHQDLSVEARRFHSALKGSRSGRTPELKRALKAMLAQAAIEQERSRRACLKAWRRFDRHPSRRALLNRLG